MKKRKKLFSSQSIRAKRLKKAPPGSSPGYIAVTDDAVKPIFNVISYSADKLEEKAFDNIDDVTTYVNTCSDCSHWIVVKGFGDVDLFKNIGEFFKIHQLEMEDVLNSNQRPKLEDHDDHIFVVERMLAFSPDEELINEQLSIFTGGNFVLTLQEKYDDIFEPLRNRLRKGKGRIRSGGTSYLTYAIMDNVFDYYFPLMEKIGDRLDALEEEILNSTSRNTMIQLQKIKRELIVFKRVAFASRDMLNDIIRTPLDQINDDTKLYLRDTYDHIMQALELIESYREVASSLMDIYLSTINTKMNQVMKVMAVFSALFLPLTFIVGIYGMNFSVTDPTDSSVIMPYNMPELYSPYGYIIVMVFILLIIVGEIWIFTRKGWMSNS